jgi:hypothetical protein
MRHPADTKREVEAILDYAMNFPMGRILRRYKEKHDLAQNVVEDHERELKRFLALTVITEQPYPMGPPIDELWHEFILSTRKYAMFCYGISGAMIHHFPGNRDPKQVAAMQQQFKTDYEKQFGAPPETSLWGFSAECEGQCDNGISCETT